MLSGCWAARSHRKPKLKWRKKSASRDTSRDVARLIPLTPAPIVVERAIFDDAIGDRDALGFALKTVADRVSRRLGSRGA